jgi:hypothetical protein
MYKVYGFIDGKWKCLTTGSGVSESAARFQADIQAIARRCKTKIVKVS